jgi:hypothetical protein
MKTMKISRREALRATIASTVAGVTLSSESVARGDDVTQHWVSRRENGFDPIHMYVHEIKNDYKRVDILGQALLILHTNFRHPAVSYHGYFPPHLTGPSAEFVTDAAWEASNLSARGTAWQRKHLLGVQLEVLRLPDSAKEADDEGPPFPPIHIKPLYEKNDVWGRAPLDRVVVKYIREGKWKRTGEFEVLVNLHHLGAQGNGSDGRMWASVIAHEMLHNLGHMHGLMEYVDGRQINAFHRAVYCDGKHRGNNGVPSFGCHPPI